MARFFSGLLDAVKAFLEDTASAVLPSGLLADAPIWTRKRAAITPNAPLTGLGRMITITFNVAPNWLPPAVH
jgi:hypothetical protein